jgi:hypothetical protein
MTWMPPVLLELACGCGSCAKGGWVTEMEALLLASCVAISSPEFILCRTDELTALAVDCLLLNALLPFSSTDRVADVCGSLHALSVPNPLL